MAASAGRSIPGNAFSTILASASKAPVLPADTTPAASPPATASIAIRIDVPRNRTAEAGFMSLPTTSRASRMSECAAARL